MKYLAVSVISAALLMGCATANKMTKLQLGMSKEEVVAVMGTPASVSAKDDSEYLNYSLSETDDDAFRGWTKPYYVRLIRGKVDSFGRTGDFDSTKTPTVRLESDQTIRSSGGTSDLYTELMKLKELRDSKIITEEEFQAQKARLLKH